MRLGEGAVLITGSTGFIGRHVTRRLYQSGRRVIALGRGQGVCLRQCDCKASWE
jgi:nucleoside-diphosphate-sugar epimerase